MKFRSQNIGSKHELFDHSEPKFTQVVIFDENNKIVAHLVGVSAKIAATVLLSALNGEKQTVIKKHSLVVRPISRKSEPYDSFPPEGFDQNIFWAMEDETDDCPYILVKQVFQVKDGIIRINSGSPFSATVKDDQGNRIMAPFSTR